MFYDPKWDAQTDDPYSLNGLIGWLEKQPGDTSYNFRDRKGRCLLCQYLADAAPGVYWCRAYIKITRSAPETELVARQTPWTFGAALKRARDALVAPAPVRHPIG